MVDDYRLRYINLLELQAAQCRDTEQDFRERAQAMEEEIRHEKMLMELEKQEET